MTAEILAKEHGLLPEVELVEVPTFLKSPNCDATLIETTRALLRHRYEELPDNFQKFDVESILSDDWSVSRFLLRCRLNPERSVHLMEASSKFRREFATGHTKLSDFSAEIHEVGGIFQYAPDRVGNTSLWRLAKLHRRCSEMSLIMKQFILCVMEQCDRAVDGRWRSGGHLRPDRLRPQEPTRTHLPLLAAQLVQELLPQGSQLHHRLQPVLGARRHLLAGHVQADSSTNRKRLRFIEGDEITKFVAPENLPDFIPRGQCKLDYKRVPEDTLRNDPQPDHKLVSIDESLSQKSRDVHKKLTTCDGN